MYICTVATQSERYFPVLLASCRRFGIELHALGWGEKWQGYAWKLRKMLDFLQLVEADDVVMFVDGYDVIILQDATVTEQRFKAMNVQMLVAVDGDHPSYVCDSFRKYIFHRVNGMYINTGTYIGYAGYLKHFLQMLASNGRNFSAWENDQELIGRQGTIDPHAYAIDQHSHIFLTLYGGTRFGFLNHFKLNEQTCVDIRNGSLYYLKKATSPPPVQPCVLHGPCNMNMNEIVTALGYKLPPALLDETSDQHYRYMRHQMSSYWPFVRHWLIVFIIGLICLLILVIVAYRYAVRVAYSSSFLSEDLLYYQQHHLHQQQQQQHEKQD